MTSRTARLLTMDLATIWPGLLLAGLMTYALWLAASPSVGWVHPELLGTAIYIWNDPGAAIPVIFRKVFDWKAFDPNVNRVRPLNDLVEVLDAFVRPFLISWTDTPSVPLPSTVLTIVLAPPLLYGWGRRALSSRLAPLALVFVATTATGFLSIVVAYIRPAKKLNFLLLCAMLFFVERGRSDGRPNDFWRALVCCYLSFFADEQALVNWCTLSLLYWRECYRRGWTRIAAMVAMPHAFLATAQWILPCLYQHFGVHGRWDALADTKKFGVFAYLADARFWSAAVVALGRSFLTVIGIKSQAPALVISAAAAVLLLPLTAVYRWRTDRASDWLAAGVATFIASAFFTLLDWYPFPFEVSYLGSFNYYYHSAIVVPIFCWLARGWRVLADSEEKGANEPLLTRTIVPSVLFIAAASNVLVFLQINTLVSVIHYYPYNTHQVIADLQAGAQIGLVQFRSSPGEEKARFHSTAAAVFGSTDSSGGFHATLSMVEKSPIITPSHLSHMVHAYYPWRKIDILPEIATPQSRRE